MPSASVATATSVKTGAWRRRRNGVREVLADGVEHVRAPGGWPRGRGARRGRRARRSRESGDREEEARPRPRTSPGRSGLTPWRRPRSTRESASAREEAERRRPAAPGAARPAAPSPARRRRRRAERHPDADLVGAAAHRVRHHRRRSRPPRGRAPRAESRPMSSAPRRSWATASAQELRHRAHARDGQLGRLAPARAPSTASASARARLRAVRTTSVVALVPGDGVLGVREEDLGPHRLDGVRLPRVSEDARRRAPRARPSPSPPSLMPRADRVSPRPEAAGEGLVHEHDGAAPPAGRSRRSRGRAGAGRPSRRGTPRSPCASRPAGTSAGSGPGRPSTRSRVRHVSPPIGTWFTSAAPLDAGQRSRPRRSSSARKAGRRSPSARGRARERQGHGEQAVGAEARVRPLQAEEALDQEARAHQQHDRHARTPPITSSVVQPVAARRSPAARPASARARGRGARPAAPGRGPRRGR